MNPARIRLWVILLILAGCNLAQSPEPTAVSALPTATHAPVSCDEFVTVALEKANSACTSLGRNQACYGNNLIETEFQPNSNPAFKVAGDIVDVFSIRRLTTSPLDTEAQVWGIAILKAQANLPDTLPGQNVTFLLFGSATLDNITPQMQAVALQTGVGSTSCASTPDSGLVVQSPEGTQSTLTINGASLTLGSTAYLKAIPQGEMTVATIEGSAVVSSFNTTRIVQPGAQVRVALGGRDGLQVTGPPSEPEPFNVVEVSAAPLSLLERQVQIPPSLANPTVNATNTPSCTARTDWNFAYIVQSGDTLFQIAQRFGLRVEELQQANCISNVNQIQVGQTIRVPRALATNTPVATSRPTNTPLPTPSDPNLRADKTLIQSGECTTIRWEAGNVSQVYFQGQPTSGNNSQQVCPASDTTYTLLVVYADGKQTPYAVRIQVILPLDTPTVTEEIPR